ncbi:hypothetical protein K438DRAFT_1534115, partial [Mycena galopus ATCC 62051]
IQSVVLEADARLASLDDEISKIRKKLKQLEDERASVFSSRTQSNTILSPLRRMPSELLGKIFLETLSSVTNDSLRGRRFDMARSPWQLTRVSSRWRAVSLSIPSLWSRIAISYN